MSRVRDPDEIIDADFYETNDTGYDGVRGVPPKGRRTGYDGIRGAAIRGVSRAAAKHGPFPVDPRALEAVGNEEPKKWAWIVGGIALAGTAFYLYNNPETLERFLGGGSEDDED